MFLGLPINLLMRGRLQRGIALFFFLFAFVDLMLCAPCNELLENFTAVSSNNFDLLSSENYFLVSASQSEDDGKPLDHSEEECFCCCSHLLASKNFFINAFDVIQPTSSVGNSWLPSSPPQTTFHPPRFS
ncbi:MAG: hypothetical protein AB1489_13870 [Acidobacteriota bacterium]